MQCNNSEDTSMASTSSIAACPVVSDAGIPCGETTGLEILEEFRKIYEARINNVDPQDENSSEVKMKIMMEWIRNLDEQNTMLVRTVKELEEAACFRVKILENKLKQTSSLLSENMSRIGRPSQESLFDLSERVDFLENDGRELKEQNEYLKTDIRGLLEVIRRKSEENYWSLDGIKFMELDPCEIPIPRDWQELGDGKNIELLKQQFQILSEKQKKSIEYQQELLQREAQLNKKLQAKEELIQKQKSKFEILKDSLKRRREVSEPEDDIIRSLDIVESALIEEGLTEEKPILVENSINVLELQNELEDKSREIQKLEQQLSYLTKENFEIREALNMEVAEKHDQTVASADQVALLEEQCRNTNMQLRFKDELITEMRKEAKQKNKTKDNSPTSPRKVRINTDSCPQKVSWGEVYSEESVSHSEMQQDDALRNLATIKAILEVENHALINLKSQLVEIFNVLNSEKNKSDSEDSKISGDRAEKLNHGIEALSKICLDNSRGIIQLEMTLQDIREKNDRIRELEEDKHDNPPPEISRQQFNAMEEFRMCTVEAQAATEDLKEVIDSVICHLRCRNELFTGLSRNFEVPQDHVVKIRESLSKVLKCLKGQLEEKNINKKTIVNSQSRLKEMKNDINEAISKFSCSTSSSDQLLEISKEISNVERDNCDSLLNKVVEEIDSIVCNLGLYSSKEDDALSILNEFYEQLCQVEEIMDDFQEKTDKILQDNQIAEKVFGEKSKRFDKLERELDYAHTRMQDNLENIVLLDQQNESFAHAPDSMSSIHKSDEPRSLEIEQLKNALCSKDQLLEHKDEIIRIQKDSIEMSQSELKDMHERSQKKIDEQVLVINRYLGEKRNLIEQSNLQNQTIKHLQDAVVEAKKNLGRNPGAVKEKTTIDLSVGDVWTSITPAVFNNGDVHDDQIAIERTCRGEMDIEEILLENEYMKRELRDRRATIGENQSDIAKKIINALTNKLHFSYKLLREKSDELVELEADHQMTINDCLILKAQSRKADERNEKESLNLLHRLRQFQRKLCETENDYKRVCQDYKKSQKLLIDAAKREVDLQHALTESLSNPEKDDLINKLKDTINYLRLELKEIQRGQNLYCMNELDFLRRPIEALEKKSADLEKNINLLARLLQELKSNCSPLKIPMRLEKIKRENQVSKKFRIGDSARSRLRKRPLVRWHCKIKDPSVSPNASTIFSKCHSMKTFTMIKSTSRMTMDDGFLNNSN